MKNDLEVELAKITLSSFTMMATMLMAFVIVPQASLLVFASLHKNLDVTTVISVVLTIFFQYLIAYYIWFMLDKTGHQSILSAVKTLASAGEWPGWKLRWALIALIGFSPFMGWEDRKQIFVQLRALRGYDVLKEFFVDQEKGE